MKSDFIAKLRYLTKEEGGKRNTPAYSEYRPHVKFPFSENMTSGKQVFLDRDIVNPGDEVTAEITILDHVTFKNALYIGLNFEFREGYNLIGTGAILEILSDDLKRLE